MKVVKVDYTRALQASWHGDVAYSCRELVAAAWSLEARWEDSARIKRWMDPVACCAVL